MINKCKHEYVQLSSCSNPRCIYCSKEKKLSKKYFKDMEKRLKQLKAIRDTEIV